MGLECVESRIIADVAGVNKPQGSRWGLRAQVVVRVMMIEMRRYEFLVQHFIDVVGCCYSGNRWMR